MGLTLWVHTLEGREYLKDSDDHSWMHRMSDELDAICVTEGVMKLSEFFDYTDLKYNYSIDPGEYDVTSEDEESLNPETGLCNGIYNMSWFEPSDGFETLNILLEAVKSGSLSDLDEREADDLCEELEDCLKKIRLTASRGGKFHLAVVE